MKSALTSTSDIALPGTLRDVALLYFWEKMSHETIAHHFGLKKATVRKRIL